MIVVYSSSRIRQKAPPGTRFINPAFFDGVVSGAEAVYLNGLLFAIRAAYEQAGVPVYDLRQRPVISGPLPPPKLRRRRRSAA